MPCNQRVPANVGKCPDLPPDITRKGSKVTYSSPARIVNGDNEIAPTRIKPAHLVSWLRRVPHNTTLASTPASQPALKGSPAGRPARCSNVAHMTIIAHGAQCPAPHLSRPLPTTSRKNWKPGAAQESPGQAFSLTRPARHLRLTLSPPDRSIHATSARIESDTTKLPVHLIVPQSPAVAIGHGKGCIADGWAAAAWNMALDRRAGVRARQQRQVPRRQARMRISAASPSHWPTGTRTAPWVAAMGCGWMSGSRMAAGASIRVATRWASTSNAVGCRCSIRTTVIEMRGETG